MKTWTIDEMLAERPCKEYTGTHHGIMERAAKRLTLLEVLDLPILAKDIVWVICRKNALTPEQQAEWLEAHCHAGNQESRPELRHSYSGGVGAKLAGRHRP